MKDLDWNQCPAVESDPEKRSGAYIFTHTRTPVSAVFQNFAAGASLAEITEWFDSTSDQIKAVLYFAVESLEAPAIRIAAERERVHAHSV